MSLLKKLLLLLTYLWIGCCSAQDPLAGCHQLLVVTTQDWEEMQGKLTLYERSPDSTWIPIQTSIPVVLGRNGLAWGIGLHSMETTEPHKKERDGKSPAGIFSLGSIFGFAPSSEMKSLKCAYLPLHEFVEAVDDSLSHYYNCLIDKRNVIPDWKSSEKMSEEPLYAIGLAVHHNFPNPKPEAGSAIFLHIWEGENFGTAGCTAMNREDLYQILLWLDENKNPALVQLPIHEYEKLQKDWKLPGLMKDFLQK